MKQCPRCAAEITEVDKVCPRCGIPIEEHSDKNRRKKNRLERKEEKRQKKLKKKEEKKLKYVSNTDFEEFLTNKNMTKKEKQNALVFDVDKNGEYNIDTDDVEIVDKETQALLQEREKQTYSVKKARGDYRKPKIKWWEIYKLANRSFARRKIKKEINKAAKIKPDFVSKPKLLTLAIFFGWFGTHNFYAQNKKKGWVTLFFCALWMGIGICSMQNVSPFFNRIESICGLSGFVVLMIWISDIINIIFNNFKYNIQRVAFISKMNIETRAKLGEKYIDMELYQKPWWTRLKVWFAKKRRDYAEYQHYRRQRLIEKEKAKQAKFEEQAKIDAEIAEYEAKEEKKLQDKKIEELVDKEALAEIKELDNEQKNENKEKKPFSKKKEAKVKVQKKKK